MPSLQRPKWNMAARAIPLAVVADVSTSPQTLYIHADHLDRPVRMSDGSKALVWDAVYRPFGAVEAITGPAALDARFPGQWFQLETGLHYNWHRHYDPTTGRYLQPDPLGFVDGPSVYTYAVNTPLMLADRDGLNPIAIPVAICSRYPALCAAIAKDVWQYCRDTFGGGGGGSSGSRRDDSPECRREWEIAERICQNELSKPRHMQNRRVTGGHRTIAGCAKGHVSARCGGNSIK